MEKTVSSQWLSKDEWKLLMIFYYKIKQLMDEFSIPFNERVVGLQEPRISVTLYANP